MPSGPTRKSLTPEKSKYTVKAPGVNVFKGDYYSSKLLEKLPQSLIELIIICNIFYFESDLTSQFKGKKFTICSNKVEVCQPCKIDVSGTPKEKFSSNAGQDSDGKGLDGLDGSAGESGGHFALITKSITFENDSTLTIISNGADGMDGQDGGDGKNGKNGKDATESSFMVNGSEFQMHSKISAEYREFIDNFGLVASQKDASHSKVTTDDGLTGYVYVQAYETEDFGFMLVKGEEPGLPGKPGGCGGFGGDGGLPGQISILIEHNEHPENIITIQNPGKNGKNGIGGLNGSKGRIGRDFCKYHLTSWPELFCKEQDGPTKFKFVKDEQPTKYSVYEKESKNFVSVEEDYKIAEPSSVKSRNNTLPRRRESVDTKAYKKPSIDIKEIIDEHSQYLKNLKKSSKYRITI